jgi:hypothetical protein
MYFLNCIYLVIRGFTSPGFGNQTTSDGPCMWISTLYNSPTSHDATAASGPGLHFQGFTITLRPTTLGRTPLDKWSAHRRNLTWQQTTLIRDRYPGPWQDSNPHLSRRAATDLCLRTRSHWDWQWRMHGVNKGNVPVPTITYCLGWECGNRFEKMKLIFIFPLRQVFPFKLFFFISQFKTFFGRKHCIKPLKMALNDQGALKAMRI